MKASQPGLAVAVVPVKAWDIRARHRCSGLPRTSGLLKLALLSRRFTEQNESQVQTDCPASPQTCPRMSAWQLQMDPETTCK